MSSSSSAPPSSLAALGAPSANSGKRAAPPAPAENQRGEDNDNMSVDEERQERDPKRQRQDDNVADPGAQPAWLAQMMAAFAGQIGEVRADLKRGLEAQGLKATAEALADAVAACRTPHIRQQLRIVQACLWLLDNNQDDNGAVRLRAFLSGCVRALPIADSKNLNVKDANKRLIEQLRKEVALNGVMSDLSDIFAWSGDDDERKREPQRGRGGGGGGGGGGGYQQSQAAVVTPAMLHAWMQAMAPAHQAQSAPAHPAAPPMPPMPFGAPPAAQAAAVQAAAQAVAVSMPCTGCGKRGHAYNACWTVFPHLRPQNKGQGAGQQ